MFCQHCGNELNSSAKFCSNCGAKVGGTKRISAPFLVLIIASTLVLLIVGAYFASLLFGSNPNGSAGGSDDISTVTEAGEGTDIEADIEDDVVTDNAGSEFGTDIIDALHQFAGRTQTLWNKEVSYELVELPESAFLEAARCTGLAPDGVTFLFGSAEGAYLWNIDTDEITFIYSANEETDDQLRLIYNENHPDGGGEVLSGSELLRSALTRYRDDSLCAFYTMIPQPYTNGPYLAVTDLYFGYHWIIDTSSGALYTGVSNVGGVYDSTLLYYSMGNGDITLRDIETGDERDVNLAVHTSFGAEDAIVQSASFLPDGSIGVVFRSSSIDSSASMSSQQELVISTPDGSTENYQLGRAVFGSSQMCIVCADADYILLYSRYYATKVPPLLVNRITGEVSMLSNEEGVITASSFDEVTHIFGAGEDTDWYNVLVPVCPMSDGESILFINGDGNLVLYRPDKTQTQKLFDEFPLSFSAVSGNNYDRFVSPGAYGYEVYLQFIVK